MTSPVELFETLAAEAASRHGVARNRRGSLVLDDGGVRAMTSRGAIVVKLDPDRVRALVRAGTGRHYKGQANAWLELAPDTGEETCRRLVDESLAW